MIFFTTRDGKLEKSDLARIVPHLELALEVTDRFDEIRIDQDNDQISLQAWNFAVITKSFASKTDSLHFAGNLATSFKVVFLIIIFEIIY